MNVVLGNPALLPALLLAGAPVLLHLFARARPKKLPFSSTRFLEQVLRQTARLKRPRSWLILALRTLLFLALLLMMLEPVLMQGDPLAGRHERKTVVVIVDASASMAAIEGARTRFAAACARASEILAGLGADDRANLVWMRGVSAAELPSPGTNKQALRETLRRAEVAMEAADVAGALRLARDMLEGQPGAHEIFVVSDFQASNWKDAGPPPEGVRFVRVPVGEANLANQAVTRVMTGGDRALAGAEVEILVEVANDSDEPVLRRVFVRSGEFSDSREVRMQPWQTATASFLARFAEPGIRAIEAAIDEDAFPFDNKRWAVLDVLPYLRAGLGGNDARTVAAWRRALGAIDWVRGEPADADSIADGAFDVVLLAAPGDAEMRAAGKFLTRGGAVLILPPEGASEALDELLGTDSAAFRRDVSPVALRIGRADHPSLAVFEQGEFGNPAGGVVDARMLAGESVSDLRPILEFADGAPAVAERAEGGRTMLWAIPLADGADFANRPEFVPLLGELLAHLTEGAAGSGTFAVDAGEPVHREIADGILDEEVELRKDGVVHPVERRGGDVPIFSNVEPLAPGVYEWLVRGAREGLAVVNFPRVESDLRLEPATDEDAGSLAPGQAAETLREGRPLWPWLLALALALALVEGLVVWRTRPVTA